MDRLLIKIAVFYLQKAISCLSSHVEMFPQEKNTIGTCILPLQQIQAQLKKSNMLPTEYSNVLVKLVTGEQVNARN